jgi:hypothetical protein
MPYLLVASGTRDTPDKLVRYRTGTKVLECTGGVSVMESPENTREVLFFGGSGVPINRR